MQLTYSENIKQKYNSGSIQNQAHKNYKTPDITLETPMWGKPAKRGLYLLLSKCFTTTKIHQKFTEMFFGSCTSQLK